VTTFAILLGSFPVSAHAQHIPGWLAVAILSPIFVFLLCIILGLLTRSVRTGARHAAYVFTWILLLSVASYYVENDYIIWTPLALYVLHAALLLILVVAAAARRIRKRTRAK